MWEAREQFVAHLDGDEGLRLVGITNREFPREGEEVIRRLYSNQCLVLQYREPSHGDSTHDHSRWGHLCYVHRA